MVGVHDDLSIQKFSHFYCIRLSIYLSPYICSASSVFYIIPSAITQHLEQQQGALSQLVMVIREDLDDLKCIEDGLTHV